VALPRPHRLRSPLALLALVGWLTATAGVEHHVAVETHTRCEHGAEVHVERIGDAVPVVPSSRPILADPTWWAEHEDHHHCSATASIVAAAPPCAAVPAVRPTPDASQLDPSLHVAVAAALFRLAPKTSPPIDQV
jgi:hypothetical protein